MSRNPALIDRQESLSIRVAWLHCVGGLTQAAVAKRLGVPPVKAHRLIARAVADGGAGQIVAVAGGTDKLQAIRAVLNRRRLRRLITDEHTAKALLAG